MQSLHQVLASPISAGALMSALVSVWDLMRFASRHLDDSITVTFMIIAFHATKSFASSRTRISKIAGSFAMAAANS